MQSDASMSTRTVVLLRPFNKEKHGAILSQRVRLVSALLQTCCSPFRSGILCNRFSRQSREPELLLWLASLGTETEYVYLFARLSLLPDFRADYEFKSATEALRLRLKLNEAKLAVIWWQKMTDFVSVIA
jgi:hypothetical protein